jgi:hypothetical protein
MGKPGQQIPCGDDNQKGKDKDHQQSQMQKSAGFSGALLTSKRNHRLEQDVPWQDFRFARRQDAAAL